MATNFEPRESIIFVQSTKIGTHENKAIHSKLFLFFCRLGCWELGNDPDDPRDSTGLSGATVLRSAAATKVRNTHH